MQPHTSASVTKRFMVSVGANGIRASITVLTGILVARGLTPGGFGDLAFLLGSFTAIRSLLDLGTAGAFYTFIAQRRRGPEYYLWYWVWLAAQFLVSVALVLILLPQPLIDKLWLGHPREMILLALAAAFMQQQVWNTVIQIGEASRNTIRVQMMGLAIVCTHLLIVVILLAGQWLSVTTVLIALALEYALASLLSYRVLRGRDEAAPDAEFNLNTMLQDYLKYCKPLFALALLGFIYEFADRWMLQRFGGAEQQGFYQVSAQFAAVSLLATASILNIFWKEISEAHDKGDRDRVAYLYRKVSRGLVMLGTLIACFLVPWSEQIVLLLLGEPYRAAWPALAIMFLHPIHQSMGQICGTMLLATERTRVYMLIGGFGMVISLPITYFLLASPADSSLGGLGMGASGLAIKLIAINVFLVNVQAWYLARRHGWNYDWQFQVAGISWALILGYASKFAACLPLSVLCAEASGWQLLVPLLLSGLAYLAGSIIALWLWPSLAGLERSELSRAAARILRPFGIK